MTVMRLFLFGTLWALVSCSGSGSGESAELFRGKSVVGTSDAAREKALRDRFATSYKDARTMDGKPAKISSFDNRSAYTGKSQFSKKAYQSEAFSKKQWKGARDAQVKSFQKQDASGQFLNRYKESGKGAREFGKRARAAGRQYETGAFGTSEALERGLVSRKAGEQKRSSYISGRRDNLPDIPVRSLRDQQLKTMAETRALMGRDQ